MTVASQLESEEEEEIATSTNPNFTLTVSPALATHTHASRFNTTEKSFNLILIYFMFCGSFRGTLVLVFDLSRRRRWMIILCYLARNSHCCVYKPVAAAHFLDLS